MGVGSTHKRADSDETCPIQIHHQTIKERYRGLLQLCASNEHRRSSGSIPLTLPLSPPALAAPQLLSVHPDQPRLQCHPPPFARSSWLPEDSPRANGAESATQKQNRWTGLTPWLAHILHPKTLPLLPLPVSARSAIPDCKQAWLDPSRTRQRGGHRHPIQTTRAAA